MKKSLLILSLSALLTLSSCGMLSPRGGGKSSGETPTSASANPSGDSGIPAGSSGSSSSGSSSSSSSSSSSRQHLDASITIAPASLNLDVYNNPNATLTATVELPAGYAMPTLNWRASNASFVEVKKTAADEKVANVKALYKTTESVVIYCYMTVDGDDIYSNNVSVVITDSTPVEPKITGVSFNVSDKNPWLDVGEEKTYKVFVSGTDGDTKYDRNVTFQYEENDVIDIVENHTTNYSEITVTPLKGGDVDIYAYAKDGSGLNDKLAVHVEPGVVEIVSIKSAPASVAKDGSIDKNDVVLNVKMDDDSVEPKFATEVEIDTSTTGVKTAKAYYGDLEPVEFDVRVYEGNKSTFTFTSKAFADSTNSFESKKDGDGYDSSRGVQVNNSHTAKAESYSSYKGIRYVEARVFSNGGSGVLKISIGETVVLNKNFSTTSDEIDYEILSAEVSDELEGKLSISLTHSGTKSVYIKSLSISQEHELKGIAISQEGKTDYKTGETFDFSGYVVVYDYTDGIGNEPIAHSGLTTNLDGKSLVPTDTELIITETSSSFHTSCTISVEDIQPSFLNATFNDKDHLLDPNNVIVLQSNQVYDLEFNVSVDPNATHKDFEWKYDCDLFETEVNNDTVHVLAKPYSSAYDLIEIKVGYQGSTTFDKAFSIKVVDADTPHLVSVTMTYDSASIKATQYEGHAFDYTGFTFTANYSNGGESQVIPGSDIAWATLVENEDPHGTYTDAADDTVLVSIERGVITVEKDTLTITITGGLSDNSFEYSDVWNVNGITVTGTYASGDSYDPSLGWDILYSPQTPAAMGETTSGNLTITFTSKDGTETSKSTTVQVKVVKDPYTNSTKLAQGTYYIYTSKYEQYISGFSGGTGSYGNKTSALEFEFKLVGNNTWTIKNGSKYLKIANDKQGTGLSLEDSETTLTIDWCDSSANTRRIHNGNRGLAFMSADVRSHLISSTTYDFGVTLEPVSKITEITSITGEVTASLGQTWNTSNLVASGKFEGNPTPQDITNFVTFECNPPTANSADITLVKVKAEIPGTTIKLEDVTIKATVNTSAVWTQISSTSSISVGMKIVIANTNASAVLSGIANDIGIVELDFNTTTVNQTYELEIVEGSVTNTFAFKSSSGTYLSYNGSGNSLSENSELNAKSSWAITFDTSGNAIIKNASYTARQIYYNSGANPKRFCCYTSTSQSVIQIYAKA